VDKMCIDCKETKLLKDYYKSKTHRYGVMPYCKSCFNLRCTKRWINRKIKAIAYKGNKCEDCGVKADPKNYVIFDFYHEDPTIKETGWQKLRLRSWKAITTELNKCALLCSNCHRLRHFSEGSTIYMS
jgi:hypothetical protein